MNSITGNTDCKVRVIIGILVCLHQRFSVHYVYVYMVRTLGKVAVEGEKMASALDVQTFNNKLDRWLEKNSKAAKKFGGDDTPAFVNGVLAKIIAI